MSFTLAQKKAGLNNMNVYAQRAGLGDLVYNASSAIGVGNVYLVIKTTEPTYAALLAAHQGTYADGTSFVYTTIQAALDATVASRNDYVVLTPSADDYDLTVALTMTKKSVHLVAPAGLTGQPGATNAVRVHQTGAFACVTLSGVACEISGIFFKGAADQTIIDISAGAHACNIHDNFLGLATTSGNAAAYGLYAAGESTNLIISNNFINNYSPTASQTIGGGIGLQNSTRALVKNNLITTGGFATTMSAGILARGAQIIIQDNVLVESKSGTPASSTFTIGINAQNDTVLMDNRVSMAVANIANAISGMHTDCIVLNYGSDASSGGVTPLQ
jgi:hypothetical protein